MTPLQPTTLIDGSRLVGHSSPVTGVRKQIAEMAGTNANVLITGESGTGKDVAATLIHRNSRASDRTLGAINCAAGPDSLLESELFGHERGAFTRATATRQGKLQHASGGTLFFDEVGDMPLLAQAKILGAIEAQVIQRLGSNIDIFLSIRGIATTSPDLEILVQDKKFRQDLYLRLNVVRLHLPFGDDETVWPSATAGFAERFVPDATHRLVAKANKRNC